MLGRIMVEVRVTHARTSRRSASPEELEHSLTGRRVESVDRKGKFLLMRLDDGNIMVAHLGMSGRFGMAQDGDALAPHTHFVATLDDGAQVRFVDPRTFGFIAVLDEDELASSGVGRLGPDAWADPADAAGLASRLAGRIAPIKALLLDQGPLAGLGNIYADEALHLAGIHPLTPGGDLDESRLTELLRAVRAVLQKAMENGGTTLDDLAYLMPDGQAGENLSNLAVYGRLGEPCLRCGFLIEKVVVRSRASHFCPVCQRP